MQVDVQSVLGRLGITQVETFANFDCSEVALRELIERDLGIARTDSMPASVAVSQLVAAWQASGSNEEQGE